jgi:hypothetical protein
MKPLQKPLLPLLRCSLAHAVKATDQFTLKTPQNWPGALTWNQLDIADTVISIRDALREVLSNATY